jgi:alpha-tubulin suppressor-like RCC1 family protein
MPYFEIEFDDPVISLTAGGGHTCVAFSTGAARCWGRGDTGQLGDGLGVTNYHTVTVSGLADATGISAGGSHTCAVRATGGIVCWGDNGWGQLGDSTTTRRLAPVAVSGTNTYSMVSAGSSTTCGLTTGGEVYCWGNNSDGTVGNGSATTRFTSPQRVVLPTLLPLNGITSIGVGQSHACALQGATGDVYCWGENFAGEVGNGTFIDANTAQLVVGL